jgi:signal transduction histidine kinase
LEFMEVNVDGRNLDLRHPARLKPGPRHIQFRYAAVHLNNPEHVRYEYNLEGFDPDWIASGNRRLVNYTSLPHGKYRLRIRAFLPEHAPGMAFFDFEVLPHFYESPAWTGLFAASLLAAAWGVYQLRLRQLRVRFSAVIEERARMAREIHDTLSQGFVGISSQLNAVAGRMHANDGVAEQHLELARRMARHSLTEARRSLMDLRVPLLDELDLHAAMSKAAPEWVAGSGIEVRIQWTGERRELPADLEQNLLRIAQEGVTNAVKHAGAGEVSIHVEIVTNKLVLAVKDDGRGFDTSAAFSMADGHFGLLGMRERAERLGGEFSVVNCEGGGSQIRVAIPIPPDSVAATKAQATRVLRISQRLARSYRV